MKRGEHAERGRAGRGWPAYIRTYGPFRAPDGLCLGVAKGLAGHFGWPVAPTRLVFVLSALFLFFWPTLLLYLGAACLLSPAPAGRAPAGAGYGRTLNPAETLNRLGRRAGSLEARLRRLEDFVTSRDFAWRRRGD